MSRVFFLILFVPVYFIAMVVLYLAIILQLETTSLEEFRLRQAVNYSVDSAVGEMLGSSDLNMDYANWGRLTIDPDLAVEAYSNCFCLNYGIPTNNENRELVQNAYTKLFVVCAYDGYYVYESRKISDDDYAYISTPKLIYKYKDNNDNTYALNLGIDHCWRMSNAGKLAYIKTPMSAKDCLKEINRQVSDDLNYRLDQYFENGWINTLYIPADVTTISTSNPINRPTVLAFVSDVDLSTAKRISAFGVGGANVTQARPVAAYKRNGRKYYCYSDLLPKELFTAINPDGSKTFIEEMFMTCEEAAEEGYYHDTLYMN